MNDLSKFMLYAVDLAQCNLRADGGPFAAVIVRNGEILAEGVNRVTSANDPTAHAEIEAIREACRRLGTFQLTGCEIYTTCEPCPMCLGAIYWARVDRVYYAATKQDAAAVGFDDSFIYSQIALPSGNRSIPFEQILRSSALAVFEEWRRKPDKTPY